MKKKIKPIGQPKIDLKTYGEDKELEYIISVTEYPKIDLKQIENINFDDYSVKVEAKEVEKRIEEIYGLSMKSFLISFLVTCYSYRANQLEIHNR